MSIAEGIAAARLAMDAGSKALDLLRHPKIDGDAVRTKITEMQDLVFSSQRALGEAEEANRDLKRQLDDRDALRALQADLQFEQDGGFFLRKSETAAGLFNPHCPVCWGDKNKCVPMKPMAVGSFKCVIHDAIYTNKAYKDEVERKQGTTIDARRSRSVPSPYLD